MDSKDYAAIIVFHTKDLKPEGIKYLVEDVNNSTWLLPLEDQKFYWSNEILRQEADRFTNDASKAWLFGTKEDARAMLVYLFNTLPGYDVTEHEFVAPAPAIEGKEELKTDLERRVEKLERNPLTTIYGPPPRDPEEDSAELKAFIESAKKMPEGKFVPNQPSGPEGKEEDKNVVLRWVKASGRLPTKFGMYVCIVKVYDDGHTFTPASFVQFDTIKGDWSNPSACGAEGKVLEWLEEISPPTPPAGGENAEDIDCACDKLTDPDKHVCGYFNDNLQCTRRRDKGAEGEGEIPEHVKDFIEKKVTEIGSPWDTFNAGMRAMGRGMWQVTEKQTKMYVEVAEASLTTIDGLSEQLSAAHAKIAELEQTIREQKEWINSHL